MWVAVERARAATDSADSSVFVCFITCSTSSTSCRVPRRQACWSIMFSVKTEGSTCVGVDGRKLILLVSQTQNIT